MMGNCQVRFLGEEGTATYLSLPDKTTGWKLDLNTQKVITFTDKKNIGKLKLIGTYDLNFYPSESIKRVRLIRRADGYYCQFILSDENAARNILKLGLSTEGHSGTCLLDSLNAWGEDTSTSSGEILFKQVASKNQESLPF